MLRTPLQARISIDHLRCYAQGELADAEPYLWTVFFKADGDTVTAGTDGFLHGECTLLATDGSHGNLGDRDVDTGDDVLVPLEIGQFRTLLRPIPHPTKTDEDFPGMVGAVLVLMEEDLVKNKAARAGYETLVDSVKKAIDEIIATRHLGNQEVTDEELKPYIERAKAAVRATMRRVNGPTPDPDDPLGFKVVRVSHDALANNYWDISERFQVVENGVMTDDWHILGEMQGALPSPCNYTHARRSQDVGSPPAASAPVIVARPMHGVLDVVYRDADKRLHELWRVGHTQFGHRDLTGAANAPAAEGRPFAYVETSTGVQIVPYRGTDRNIYALSWAQDIRVDNMSGTAGAAAAIGEPVGIFNEVTGTNHIVYPGWLGPVRELFWAGAHDPVHDGGILTGTGTNPSLYFNSAGSNIMVFRGHANSHIYAMRWNPRDPNDRGEEELSNVAGTPPAAGDPVACYVAAADLNQVVHRSGDGHLWELSWPGIAAVVGRDLTAQSGAPPAESDPAVFFSALTNTTHVVYRGPSGHLFEIRWTPGGMPAFVDLTVAALAPRAVDRPAAVAMDTMNLRYVVYRGTDNQIHEISWTGNP